MANTDGRSNTNPLLTGTPSSFVLPDNIDPFLLYLVDIANAEILSFGITLNVGGVLVTGQLVSYEKYYEGLQKDITHVAGAGGEALAEVIAQFLKHSVGEKAATPKPEPLPRHIHLQHAQIVVTADGRLLPRNHGVWWRAPIAAVSGFTLGSLSSS